MKLNNKKIAEMALQVAKSKEWLEEIQNEKTKLEELKSTLMSNMKKEET